MTVATPSGLTKFPLSGPKAKKGFAELPWGKIHYRLEGTGPFVVLAHGYGANLHMWAQQRAALGKHFTVLTYDLPGFGLSDPLPLRCTMEDFATAQAELMEHLGIDKAHIGGLSFGGMVALTFGAMYKNMTASLLLCDTIAARLPAAGRLLFSLFKWRGDRGGAQIDWVGRLEALDAHPDKARWGVVPEERLAHLVTLTRHQNSDNAAKAAQAVAEKPDYGWALETLHRPLFIIVGTADFLLPWSLDMHEQQPQSQLMVLEDVNHGTAVIHPHAFNQSVLAFLKQVEAGVHPAGTYFQPRGFPLPDLEPTTLAHLRTLVKKPTALEMLSGVWERILWNLLR